MWEHYKVALMISYTGTASGRSWTVGRPVHVSIAGQMRRHNAVLESMAFRTTSSTTTISLGTLKKYYGRGLPVYTTSQAVDIVLRGVSSHSNAAASRVLSPNGI